MRLLSKPKALFFLSYFILFSIFTACNEAEIPDNQSLTEENSNNKVLRSVSDVFLTLPSPNVVSKLISQSGVKFNPKILNPIKNVPYYETTKSLALNLGIYSADMSYISYYNQKQLTLEYLSAIKLLADNLGIINTMNREDIVKLEDNIFNQDSLRIVLEDIFFSSGKYLNENNQPEMALLIQIGGWLEGMYIAMQLATQSIDINKELVDRIVEQRESLNMVIKSLESYSDYEVIYDIHKDMLNLQKIYNKTIIPEQNTTVNKTNNLANKAKANVTPDIFISLYKEINKIRNSYTQ